MPAEGRCLGERQPPRSRTLAPELLVRISGIGLERAARAARQRLAAGAGALLCFGVSGALDPTLRCGDIVLAAEVLSAAQAGSIPGHECATFSRIRTAAEWRRGLAERLASRGPVHIGAIVTCQQLIDSRQRKQQLFARSGAIAVDMESAAVARVAQEHDVPFMALRVIADTAQDALPSALHAALGHGAADAAGARFWWSLLSAPSAWPGLARLGRRYRHACGVLTRCGRAGVAWAECAGAPRPA